MSKRAKIFGVIALGTWLLILFKIQLCAAGEFYISKGWLENILIYTGVAVLMGGLAEYLADKFKGFGHLILWLFTLLTGACTYFTQVTWMYFMNGRWWSSIEADKLLQSIKSSETPWLFSLIAVGALLITYLVLQKHPRLINPEVTEDLEIRRDIDDSKVDTREYSFESEAAKHLMLLRDYDYCQHSDLGFINAEQEGRFNADTDKFIAVEYDGQPMGYFIVRNRQGFSYDITEIYASHMVDESFRALFPAFKKYMKALGKGEVTLKNIGLMENITANVIEILIKSLTDASYELIGTGRVGGKINYDICFRI